jgi:thiol:disulfide interchange protein DsbC
VTQKDCDNPIADHYRLAQRMGIRATPTILASNGRTFRGYVPPARLLAKLEAGEG